MADRYWVGGSGTWNSSGTTKWSAASGVSFTGSRTGTALTTTGNPALVAGMTLFTSSGTASGTIVSGSGNSWVTSASGTIASSSMSAATIGASVPTASDNVFFDANSNMGTTTFTITMANTPRVCNDITISTDATMTLAGSGIGLTVYGSLSFPTTLFSRTYTGLTTFASTATGKTITTNGKTLTGGVTFDGVGGSWTLGSALDCVTGTITNNNGTFNSGGYSLTADTLAISGGTTNLSSSTVTLNTINTASGTVNFGSSTVTLSNINIASGTVSFGSSTVTVSSTFNNSSTATINLNSSTITVQGSNPLILNSSSTFNAGTSTINLPNAGSVYFLSGFTYYNVTINYANIYSLTFFGSTFNTLTFTCNNALSTEFRGSNTINTLNINCNSLGVSLIKFFANQTINTFNVNSSPTFGYNRVMVLSDAIGSQRSIAVSGGGTLSNVDFRDIAITGTTLSGTRLGDCKGNSGITFDTPKTVYYVQTDSAGWADSSSWAATPTGYADSSKFPLAQDTAVFTASYPSSGNTVYTNANYNIGTIDMSAKTSNTMTLDVGSSPIIYGNWINGTGVTISGTTGITFSGRTTQTITNSGVPFTQQIVIDSPSGSVTLQDSFTSTNTPAAGLVVTNGTFNASTYNVTLSTSLSSSNTNTRTIAIGSGTWTFTSNSGTAAWSTSTSTGLTVTGTGTISFTGTASKIFFGGDVSYSGITLNQGGTGNLTISGSNTFGNITNTVQPASIIFSTGTTNTFNNFNLSGTSGNLITISSDSAASHTLSKTSGIVNTNYLNISNSTATGGAAWYAGSNSVDGSGNTGWIFTAPPSATATGNFLVFF